MSAEETFKTSSLDVKPSDILARTAGRIRFFSVDGCHLYREVENDLRLAESTLTPDGIIAVDDFFNPNWADVSFATYDFLRRTDKMAPFAITSKLFLAAPEMAERCKSALSKLDDLGQISTVQILGRDVLAARQGVIEKGYEAFRGLISRRAS